MWQHNEGYIPFIFFKETASWQKMVNLRRAVGDIVPATDNDAKTRISIPASPNDNVSHWINTEDFQYFAQHLKRPIAIIVRDNYSGEITYRYFLADGEATDSTSILDGNTFCELITNNSNTLILYYSNNHYQAIVKDEDPK